MPQESKTNFFVRLSHIYILTLHVQSPPLHPPSYDNHHLHSTIFFHLPTRHYLLSSLILFSSILLYIFIYKHQKSNLELCMTMAPTPTYTQQQHSYFLGISRSSVVCECPFACISRIPISITLQPFLY